MVNKSDESGITALHLSRTPEIVRLLLDYGADSNATDNNGKDVLEALIEKSCDEGQMEKTLMDNFIEKNEEALDSSRLQLVYNMEFFKPWWQKKSDGKIKYQNEMSNVKRIYKHKSDLLHHPLTQAMTTIKWNCWSQRRKRYLSTLLKSVFALSLTLHVINPVYHRPDDINTIRPQNGTNGTNLQNWENTEFVTKHNKVFDYAGSSLLFIIAFLSAILLFIREFRQFLGDYKKYFTWAKNWTELLMIIFTILHLVSVILDSYRIPITDIPIETQRSVHRSIEAISIFLAWINIVFMASSIPKVGIYVYMFMNVSKTVLFFLLIYSPAIMAFALCFRSLMPKVVTFRRIWTALLKTMAMLVGELDYDGSFMDMPQGKFKGYEFGTIVIQMISILFLCFGCIVIMNLLVGITVSEIEKLKLEACQISLGEKVYKLINDSESHVKQLNRKKSMDEENFKKDREEETLPFLQELRSVKNKKGEKVKLDNTIKLCVEPNHEQKDEMNEEIDQKFYQSWLKFASNFCPDSLIDKSSNVYFYSEGEKRDYTGVKFSKELIEHTKLCLKSKEDLRKDLERKLQETQLDVVCRNTDVVCRNTDETLDFLRKNFSNVFKTDERQPMIWEYLLQNSNNVLKIEERQSEILEFLHKKFNNVSKMGESQCTK